MTAPAPRIDIEALKERIDLEDVIRACGVDLKKHGAEYSALCPFHSEKTPSFKVTPKTQLYYCAGCGAGGDSIKFLMEYRGVGFKDAATILAEIAGGGLPVANDNRPQQREARREPEAPKWIKTTAPDNAPPAPTSLRIVRDGQWTDTPVVKSWAYRNRAGELLGYTCRVEFEKPDGTTGKDVIPVTWQTSTETGDSKWRQGALEEPRPLYGAELLDDHPDANVILVEGEKACDAGRRMINGKPFLVLTWPGGCKAVDKADWSMLAGRKVAGWPDCDSQRDKRTQEMRAYTEQPGMAAMLRIAELLEQQGVEMRIVAVDEPGCLPDGWDLADAEAEGWDGDRVMAEMRARLATPAQLRERVATPAVEPEPVVDDEPPPAIETEQPSPRSRKKSGDKEDRPPPRDVNFVATGPVRALGYNHGRYYYLSGSQRQVHEYQKHDHGSNGLMQLAPLMFWQDTFAYGAEMKSKHWQSATDSLMRQCERAGIFDTAIIRGRGCWIDEGRLALNLGNRVILDGAECRVEEVDSEFIYEAGARLRGPADDKLPVAEARRVIDIAKRFNWEMPASAALLAGWIVLAPLCGALRWRPHVWLSGGTGTGKSTILNDFVAPLMAGMELQVQGNSTEAGIRQSLRADARPVLFDESEQNDEREENRVQNILSLIRQSSSESQSRTLKGTTTGRSLEFHIRSMFCLASIQVGIKRQADHTRISVLSLYGNAQVPKDEIAAHQEKWLETERMLAELREDAEFSGRLLARSIAMYDTIRENMRTLVRVAAREFKSQRLGDQYGTLLAGTATLFYDHPISEEGAIKLIKMFDWSIFHEAAHEDESADALTAIMQIETRVEFDQGGPETRTVGELVRIVADGISKNGVSPTDAGIYLGRLGLKVERPTVGNHGMLLVANKSVRLQRELRGQPYAADWRSYLRRLPGAKSKATAVRFCDGHVSRATEIPIEVALPPDGN